MGFFKNLFAEKEPPPRHLEHPKDLQVDDIVSFGFAEQALISNRSLRVLSIQTLDLGGEAKKKTCLRLESEREDLRLAVVRAQGRERLELGLPILPEVVGELFNLEHFAALFDADDSSNFQLERQAELADLQGWTAPVYRQEAAHQAYYYEQDLRTTILTNYTQDGMGIDYYRLVSDAREHALEALVFDGGRTEVYLLVSLSLAKIEGLWPAGSAATK